jgi:GNAT superfamily N-acetyltransferase
MQSATSLSPDQQVRIATAEDSDTLIRLINAAFIVERPIIDGDRINTEKLNEFLAAGKFLLLEERSQPIGCVYVELKGDRRGYIGLLAIEPARQKAGLGRKLIAAAEKFLKESGCESAFLRVVHARAELQPIYERLGYSVSGIAPIPDSIPMRIPSYFTVMTKDLR